MIVLGLFVQETKERKAKADQEAIMLAAMVQELTHELGELQVQLMTGLDEDDGEYVPE